MQTESQYIATQDTILDTMQALLGDARNIGWEISDLTNERNARKSMGMEWYLFDQYTHEQLAAEIKRLQAAQDLKLVAYTQAQVQMINGMIDFVKSGIPATAELVHKFSTNRLQS